MATFRPFRESSAGFVEVTQHNYNVDIHVKATTQHMDVVFYTPDYIEQDEISISDIVPPVGTTDYTAAVVFSSTVDKTNIWSLRVFTTPADLEGVTSFKLNIRDEVFNVTSRYELPE